MPTRHTFTRWFLRWFFPKTLALYEYRLRENRELKKDVAAAWRQYAAYEDVIKKLKMQQFVLEAAKQDRDNKIRDLNARLQKMIAEKRELFVIPTYSRELHQITC